jgi:regulator of protease activity HflC (stomatin/prohibitin superfamily)
MSNSQQSIPDTPASLIKTELEREMRLAEEYEVEQEANQARILDEALETQARVRAEAAVMAAKNEALAAKKAKAKARGEEASELTAERYGREMRSNGTVAQQEEWRTLTHEVCV